MPFDGIVTRAVMKELADNLVPGKITKIYQPTNTELILTIRSRGENHSLLLSIHPSYARFHLTEDAYKNPLEPPMFCMVLRKHLSGAIVEAIEQDEMERIVTFSVKTRNEIGDVSSKTLIIELMGKHSNVMLIDQDRGHIIDSFKHISMAQNRHRTILPGHTYIEPPKQNKSNPLTLSGEQFIAKLDFNAGQLDKQMVGMLQGFSPLITAEIAERANPGTSASYQSEFLKVQELITRDQYVPAIYRGRKEDFHVLPLTETNGEKEDFSTVSTMLDTFYSGKAERDRVKQQAKDLHKFLKNERDKNKRKLKKHAQTLKKAESADHYQKYGELLTAHMHLVKQGDASVTVVDYYHPEQPELVIELDANKTPSENAQSFYKHYQKLKKSKQAVEKEITKTNEELRYFDQLLQQIDSASMEDIEEIREELREEGYLKKQKARKKKNKPKKPMPETYMATDGTEILVGKNNKQNEYVTNRIARQDEIWLHTKDIPGSHVVIRNSDPSEETLVEAAEIAAYFSKSKGSSSVPVDYTKIRHVKKPNGAKPGYVIYDNQKTLFVTPEEKTIENLKKRKQNG